MEFNRSMLFPAVAAVLLALSGCQTTLPIQDVTDAALQPRGDAALEDVDEAIWRAGRRLDWQTVTQAPGHLSATFRHKAHIAVVSITHDGERFTIRYRTSENLGHALGRIHPSYNVWVTRLAEAIRAEPIRPRASGRR